MDCNCLQMHSLGSLVCGQVADTASLDVKGHHIIYSMLVACTLSCPQVCMLQSSTVTAPPHFSKLTFHLECKPQGIGFAHEIEIL